MNSSESNQHPGVPDLLWSILQPMPAQTDFRLSSASGWGANREVRLLAESDDSAIEVIDRLEGLDGERVKFRIPSDVDCLLRGFGAELFRSGEKLVEITWKAAGPVDAEIESQHSDSASDRPDRTISLSAQGQSPEIVTQLRSKEFIYRDWGVRPDAGPWRQFKGEVPVTYLLEEVEGASDLAVVFSALGPAGSFTFNYKNTLDGLPFHRLYVLDDFGDQGAYFYSESRDLRIYRSVLRAIEATLRNTGVPRSRVHMLGTSKGGTAALIFGSSMGVANIFVGAPQVNIGSFLKTPHPNILEFMTAGVDQESVDWADRIVRNHLRRLSDDTEIHVLIGDADHHFRTHHAELMRLLQEQHGKKLTTEVCVGVDHKGIGKEYRRWIPTVLMRAAGQRQVLDMRFEGWRLTGFACGQDLLLRMHSPQDGSSAAVYVYSRQEATAKHRYDKSDRWLHHVFNEDVTVRFFVKRSGAVKVKSLPTVSPKDAGVHRDRSLQRAARSLVPASVGEAARRRGTRMFLEGVVTHPTLGGMTLDPQLKWSAIEGRTDQRYLHGFLFLVDWHEEVLPLTPSAAGRVVELFRIWVQSHPRPTSATDPNREGMAYHDETTAQRGLHLARFMLENWPRLVAGERRFLESLLRDMVDLLSSDWFYGGVNNHGMFQDCSLFLLASTGKALGIISDTEEESASAIASERLLRYFRSSFSSEGVHLENSPGYHLMASRSLRDIIPVVFKAAPDAGDSLKAIYSAAERYATHAIMPNGMLPPLSDTKQFEVGRSNHSTTFSGEEYAWAATAGRRGRMPGERTAVFPDAGYAVHRSSWRPDADWIFFCSGYKAQYHHHADDLSLLFFREGGLVLSEAGPFGYDYSDPRTKYAFSQWAHSTIVVDGRSLPRVDAEPGGVSMEDLTGIRGADGGKALSVRGVCQRHPEWAHTRDLTTEEIGAGRLRAEVVDRVKCTDGVVHHFECLWHAGPGITIQVDGDSALFLRGSQAVLRMSWSSKSSAGAVVKRESDSRSPRALRFPVFGVSENGSVLSLEFKGHELNLTTTIE